jgi:signal peptidase I
LELLGKGGFTKVVCCKRLLLIKLEREDEKMGKVKQEIWSWVKTLIIAALIAFGVKTFLLASIIVEGASMQPTLQDQERTMVTKIGEPKRFDIIVFHATENKDYIKRVIGLPGDQIEYKNDTLYINGQAYQEPYLEEAKKKHTNGNFTQSFSLKGTSVGAETVPEGHLFVMGDNRPNSEDSRHIGAIPIEKVVGTSRMVYFPFKELKVIGNDS